MDLRDWVRRRFGGTGATLLDASVYSAQELRTDLVKLRRERERLKDRMDEQRETYRELIQEGADATEQERKHLTMKAKIAKKKLAVTRKRHRATGVKLGTLRAVQGLREVLDEEDDDLALDAVLDDSGGQEIGEKLMAEMQAADLEMEELREIGETLDVPVLGDQIDVGASHEEQLMTDVATGELDEEDLDVAPGPSLDPDLVPSLDAAGDDSGLDLDESGLAFEEDPLVGPVVREIQEHGLLEVDLERDDERLASITLDDEGYAARWTQQVSLEDVLEWVTADEGVADDPRVEAFFRGGDADAPERVPASLSAVREDERFPARCGFLAVAGDGFELAWEDDQGAEGAEMTVSVDGTSPAPFRRVYRRHEGLTHDEVAEVLGRTEDVLEAGVDDG